VRDAGVAPAILRSRQRLTLLVPRGLLVLSRREPQLVVSILAHEFCHVLHRDVGLWHLEWIRQQVQLHRVVPYAIVSGAGVVIALGSGQSSLVLTPLMMAVTAPLGFRLARRQMRRLRTRSETLADLGAAIATGSTTTFEAVRRFGGHALHGDRSEDRLALLALAFPESEADAR